MIIHNAPVKNMPDKNFIAIIPSRLGSTRLPRKVLADINGQPLIWHVWHHVNKATLVSRVIIATDSKEIQTIAQNFGAEVLLTSKRCRSGTERIASIINDLDGDLIINIQGDEPLIDPQLIDDLIIKWREKPCDIITAARRITDPSLLSNSNVVKVVRAFDGRALYFSRSPVPHVRDQKISEWLKHGHFWQHIGIYGYSRKLLEAYPNLPVSPLEAMEKLEQLRFLEAGYTIRVIETEYQPHPVDVQADLDEVRLILEKNEGLYDIN